jgi:excinuclease ABC subunit B
VVKRIRDLIDGVYSDKGQEGRESPAALPFEELSEKDLARRIKQLEKEMLEHARSLEFEKAARVRDQLAVLKQRVLGAAGSDRVTPAA